jgi:outer membrane protein
MGRYGCGIAMTLMMTAAGRAAAQEPLTLDRAVQAVLAGNAQLRAARAAGAEAEARASDTRSGAFPRISVSESWQRGDQPVFVFSSLLSARRFAAADFAIDSLNHPDPIGFFRMSVGVEQVLFDGGRQRSAVAAASGRLDAALAATDQAAADLVLKATETFGRVIAAQAGFRAAEAGLAAAREDLARAGRRRDAGMATDAEVLALSVHAADLERRAIQSDGDAGIARAELNRLMGAPVDRGFIAVEPAIETSADHPSPDVAALFAAAEAARPEIKGAAALSGAAQAGRRQARAALLPQIIGQAAMDLSGTRFSDRRSAWIAGGELRWTFSTGGGELAQRRAAAAAALRAEAEADEARAAVHVDVVTALLMLETARARQAAGRAALEQAREGERIVRNRFDAGVAGVSDVLRASTDVLDAEGNRISALVDAIVGSAMLRRAIGRMP